MLNTYFLRFVLVLVLVGLSFGLFQLINLGWFQNASLTAILVLLFVAGAIVLAFINIVISGILASPKKEKNEN